RRDSPIAVIAEYALVSKVLDVVPDPILRLIDTVEVFYRNKDVKVDGLRVPVMCTPESEEAAYRRADVLIAIQANDGETIKQKFPEKRVITVAHAYNRGRPRPPVPSNGTVLYVGSSNPFNVHGLREFINNAWESVLARVPHATLRVV